MKKLDREKTQVRRKKTVADIRTDRKVRAINSAHTESVSAPTYDKELVDTSVNCNHLLLAAAQVGNLLANRQIIANIPADKLVEFKDQAVVYAKDVGAFRTQLKDLDSHLAKIRPEINDPDNIMEALTMGQAYAEFVESFNNVVIPNQLLLLETIETATELPTSSEPA